METKIPAYHEKILSDLNRSVSVLDNYTTDNASIKAVTKIKEGVRSLELTLAVPVLKPETQAFRNVTEEMTKTYIRKNADYGNSFDQSLDEFGPISAIVRISDKFNRLKSLATSDDIQVKDESINDTLLDMANYCIMTHLWLKKNKK